MRRARRRGGPGLLSLILLDTGTLPGEDRFNSCSDSGYLRGQVWQERGIGHTGAVPLGEEQTQRAEETSQLWSCHPY